MPKVAIKGDIIPNDYADIYEWLGMDGTAPKSVAAALADANGEDVDVEINSPGGYVDSGVEIYTALRNYSGKVTTQVVGLAASSASIIAMAGDTIEMSPAGMMMIHKAAAGGFGNRDDMQMVIEMLDATDQALANAYVQRTGLSADEVLKMMASTYWLTPQDAIEKGFADKMMFEDDPQPLQMTAGMSPLNASTIGKIRNLMVKPVANGTDEQLKMTQARLQLLKLGGTTHD